MLSVFKRSFLWSIINTGREGRVVISVCSTKGSDRHLTDLSFTKVSEDHFWRLWSSHSVFTAGVWWHTHRSAQGSWTGSFQPKYLYIRSHCSADSQSSAELFYALGSMSSLVPTWRLISVAMEILTIAPHEGCWDPHRWGSNHSRTLSAHTAPDQAAAAAWQTDADHAELHPPKGQGNQTQRTSAVS